MWECTQQYGNVRTLSHGEADPRQLGSCDTIVLCLTYHNLL
jgi:hypothetical protein